RTRTTMMYVTHDQVEAMTLGDRIVVLDRGRVQQVASPREIYERPANAFVAGFIGNPPMNLFPARVSVASGRPALLVAGTTVPVAPPGIPAARLAAAAGTGLSAGIRPEAVEVSSGTPGAGALAATVEHLECLGPQTLVHLCVADDVRLIARVGGIAGLGDDVPA